MVVSFRFFLTLNPDDGSKPTPTMETHVPPEGDGKSPLTTPPPVTRWSDGHLVQLAMVHWMYSY